MKKITTLAAAAVLALSVVPASADTAVQSDPFASTQGFSMGAGAGVALGVGLAVVLVAASGTN